MKFGVLFVVVFLAATFLWHGSSAHYGWEHLASVHIAELREAAQAVYEDETGDLERCERERSAFLFFVLNTGRPVWIRLPAEWVDIPECSEMRSPEAREQVRRVEASFHANRLLYGTTLGERLREFGATPVPWTVER